jgi:hypothetical protein
VRDRRWNEVHVGTANVEHFSTAELPTWRIPAELSGDGLRSALHRRMESGPSESRLTRATPVWRSAIAGSCTCGVG